MSNYLVLYTIKNDENSAKRNQFVTELDKIGLKKFEDQSTNFGSFEGNLDGITKKLQDLKESLLEKDDVVTLFYADSWPVGKFTIKERAI